MSNIGASAVGCAVILAVGIFLIPGCGGEKMPDLVEVTVVVQDADGNPLSNVKVSFLPDPEADNLAGPSTGTTNENGECSLLYRGNEKHPGVAVGKCRVILSDITAIETERNEDGGTEMRFDMLYTRAGTTPLSFDVKPEDGQRFVVKIE